MRRYWSCVVETNAIARDVVNGMCRARRYAAAFFGKNLDH